MMTPEIQQTVLNALSETDALTIPEIAEITELDSAIVMAAVDQMETQKRIIRRLRHRKGRDAYLLPKGTAQKQPEKAGQTEPAKQHHGQAQPLPESEIPEGRQPEKQPEPKPQALSHAKVRNKPYTPNPTAGYRVEKGKVLIFLDRRATSRTLTLTVKDLQELVRAVEKAA